MITNFYDTRTSKLLLDWVKSGVINPAANPDGDMFSNENYKLWTVLGVALNIIQREAIRGKETIYKIGKNFASELKKVNANVDMKYLHFPHISILIEIPPGILSHPETTSNSITAVVIIPSRDQTYLVCAMSADTEKINHFAIDPILHQFTEDFINQATRAWSLTGNVSQQSITELLQFICNVLMYLKSGNPDLREYRPKHKKSFKIKGKSYGAADKNDIFSILVGFDYKKPKLYSVDNTQVSGHFRWQPYGEAYSKIKLIWIDSHIRTFKNY